MPISNLVLRASPRTLPVLIWGLSLLVSLTFGQQQTPTPQTDDVVRVRTDLVQTDGSSEKAAITPAASLGRVLAIRTIFILV